MKKILMLFVVVGLMAFSSCTGPEGPPGFDGEDGLTPVAFEIKNQNLFMNTSNSYSLSNSFMDEIGADVYGNDTVLIYRLSGYSSSNLPIWQLIPRTINFSNGDKLDYDFDFSVKDYLITAKGNYNLSNRSEFILNQTFRVVIVQVELISSVNTNNYLEVMNALNLKENQVQKINF